MAKRLREGDSGRKVNSALRGQALVRATQEKQERQRRYADWQWGQVSLAWLMVTLDDEWAELPCDVRHRMLQDIVRILFERRISLQMKVLPLREWLHRGDWTTHSFVPQYDAFLHDALVKPFVVRGDMAAKKLEYQLVDNGTAGLIHIKAFQPIDSVEQFTACLDAARPAHISILFRYQLVPIINFDAVEECTVQ